MQETVKTDRQKYIGGSDIPAIMGISPFRSRFQLLREKAGLEENPFKVNKYTEYGNVLEPKIRDYLNNLYPETNFNESKHINDKLYDIPVRVHLDGENEKSVLEIKTVSEEVYRNNACEVAQNLLRTEYKHYLVQTLFYMMITGKDVGCIAVYSRPEDMNTKFDGDRLRCYWLTADEYQDVMFDIEIAVRKFCEDVSRMKQDPFLSEIDFLPAEIQQITDKMIILEDKLNEYKKMQNEYEKQKQLLYEAMINNRVESFKTVNGITLTAVKSVEPKDDIVQDFDLLAFASAHPKLMKKFTRDIVKHNNGRKGYLKITYNKEVQT